MVTGSLPVTILPGESRLILVAAKMPNQVGLFTRKAGLLVDDNGMRRVNFRITGRIRNEAAPSPVTENGR
jgi:hypothetical protein